jgi:glycosyltransferase involved in cell wall biosynthesis
LSETGSGGRPPHIVHIITGLGGGGAERMLVNLVTHPSEAGLRHTVIALTPDGFYAGRLRAAGIDLHEMRFRRGPSALVEAIRCVALIRRLAPDIIQTWLYHADLVGLIAGRLTGCRRVVWNLRCSDMALARYHPATRIVVKLLALLSPLPRVILSNSEAGRDWHRRLGYRPRRWEIIGNGVDETRFRPDPAARESWRKTLGLGDGMLAIGMVARRDPMKDQDNLVRAVAALDRPDIALVLVGRGIDTDPALKDLAAACPGPVRLLPQSDRVADVINAFDIAVLASKFGEGFPNVLIEAMATALPTVTTAVGDAARVVGETGLAVPPGDRTALTAALARLAGDSALRRTLGDAARRRVETTYTLAAIRDRYDAFYLALTDG